MNQALRKIAEDLRNAAAEIEAGHPVSPDIITTAARRLEAQAEMIEEGLTGDSA